MRQGSSTEEFELICAEIDAIAKNEATVLVIAPASRVQVTKEPARNLDRGRRMDEGESITKALRCQAFEGTENRRGAFQRGG